MPDADQPDAPIVIKKYANRRLYDTESSVYITLDTLADMVRSGRAFVVFDARTGDDITRSVLTQIIMEEETRGRAMLPATFLRQIIRFYGDTMQGLVPDYLDRMMEQFAASQKQIHDSMQRTMEAFLPPEMEKIGRRNREMVGRAMSLFATLHPPMPDGSAPPGSGAAGENGNDHVGEDGSAGPMPGETMAEEVARLRREVAMLRRALAAATAQ